MKPYFKHFNVKALNLPYINPLMGGIQQCSRGYTYGPVMRRYYIIEYIIKGCGEYTVNGKVHKASAGEAFIIKPYEVHLLRADNEDPWEYVWVGFTTDLELPTLLAERYVFDASEVEDIFMRLGDGKHENRNTVDYASEIYNIFMRLYALQSRESDKNTDFIDKAISIIKNEYATVTVQKLADRLFVNRSYLGVQFKKKVGKTPKEYIDSIRLSTAAMMIAELGYTVTQAALATGYSDVMSFSKMYKKHFGKSPRGSIKNNSKERTIMLK